MLISQHAQQRGAGGSGGSGPVSGVPVQRCGIVPRAQQTLPEGPSEAAAAGQIRPSAPARSQPAAASHLTSVSGAAAGPEHPDEQYLPQLPRLCDARPEETGTH